MIEKEDKNNLEPFITIPQLVKGGSIALGETKLYELANTGKIPSYRVGKKILVKESEVHQAIKAKFGKKFIYGQANKRSVAQ